MNITIYDFDKLTSEVEQIVYEYERVHRPAKENSKNRMKTRPMFLLVHEHIKERTGITTPKNYASEKQLEWVLKEYAKVQTDDHEYVEKESKKIECTIVTPFDIMRGDNSIIEYDEEERKSKMFESQKETNDSWEKGLQQRTEEVKEPSKPVLEDLSFMSPKLREQFFCDNVDIILPKFFRPTLQLTYPTMDGRKAAIVSHNVVDEICKLGRMWKLAVSTSHYRNDLYSLIHYIQRDGEVVIRETRNDDFIVLK